jgi:ribosomal protein S18 acetylase RimI-like enzyme
MKFRIVETHAQDRLWRHIERYSPQTVGYIADPTSQSDHRCFVALGEDDEFIGLATVDLGPLRFGPLAQQTVGCLENILVLDPFRRQGVGTALLQSVLSVAWRSQARHVWWTVDYANSAAIAFYQSNGAVFIAEEDPQADNPEKYYTVVIPSPALAAIPANRQNLGTTNAGSPLA